MERLHLFEWEDQPWFPHALRNYLTDLLQFSFTLFAPRAPVVVEKLRKLLDSMQEDAIVDLCSGSSGPLLWFRQRLEEERRRPVSVLLTDKFPNLSTLEEIRQRSGGRVDFIAASVDAAAVPAELPGVRTLFTSFHHFRPQEAQRILQDAVARRRAIAIFETPERTLRAILALLLATPFAVLLVTPFIRPFRPGRLFWTYLVPLVPLLAWWDGTVSCLRAYSPRELEEMVARLDGRNYAWEIGRAPVRGTPAHVTYLIGYPQKA